MVLSTDDSITFARRAAKVTLPMQGTHHREDAATIFGPVQGPKRHPEASGGRAAVAQLATARVGPGFT
jgi:hypothetical protein